MKPNPHMGGTPSASCRLLMWNDYHLETANKAQGEMLGTPVAMGSSNKGISVKAFQA